MRRFTPLNELTPPHNSSGEPPFRAAYYPNNIFNVTLPRSMVDRRTIFSYPHEIESDHGIAHNVVSMPIHSIFQCIENLCPACLFSESSGVRLTAICDQNAIGRK